MSSTRSSSPSDDSASERYINPKSKLEALLAASGSGSDAGSDSDEDLQSPLSRASGRPQIENIADSSDDEVVRPRGRFAARMLGSVEGVPDDSTPTKVGEDDAPESVRDRVRRLLRLDEPDAKASGIQEPNEKRAKETPGGDDDQDEDEIPVMSRRRGRTERHSTPDLPPDAPPSPGLFVSPGQKSARDGDSTTADEDSNDDDNDDSAILPKLKNSRVQALVDRKRREREAKEAEEEAKRAARPAPSYDDDEGNSSGITDDEAGHKMSQAVRPPTRKASRKAIEDMNRETQRMARSMQLAHQATTKKRISKTALFEKFKFKPAGAAPPVEDASLDSSSRPTTPISEVEMKDVETLPSSPPTMTAHKVVRRSLGLEEELEDDFPPVDQIPATSSPRRARSEDVASEGKKPPVQPKRRRVRVKLPSPTVDLITIDSDDELSIVKSKSSKLDALFNRAPKNGSKKHDALQIFRCLAQVSSSSSTPHGKKVVTGMTAAEMEAMLRTRAREQAKAEKERRIETLKAKGVVIQTEEERRKEIEEVEDIVARAREEAEEIMQREREDAKKERKKKRDDGEVDPLGWDDSEDDGDYEGSAEEDGDDEEEREIELSGSEDEDIAIGSGDETPNPLFESEADEDGSESSDVDKDVETVDKPKSTQADDDEEHISLPRARRSRTTRVLSDDEDEDTAVVKATPRPPKPALFRSPAAPGTSPAVPATVLRSARKTFIPGLPIAPCNPAGLGLTQMFAGTMADSQMMSTPTQPMTSPPPMPTFDLFAQPTFADSQDMQDDDVVMDSQPPQETQGVSQGGVDLHYSQTQMRGLDSLTREDSTQLSQYPLTQDYGLEVHTPLRERFIDAPVSTIATVPTGGPTQPMHESPLVRRGRLRQRMASVPESPEREENEREGTRASPGRDEFGFNTTSAFGVMDKAARDEERRNRRKQKEFDRRKSKAVGMIEEQAEESEDEYAGLGGVDDDDDDDSDLASVKDLIDDEKKGNTEEEERNAAAFFAERERADAEREVDQLFKDVTTGGLRRKRANDYDLSDSDDGGEARKRRKQRQFAKRQKALFADERVKKMSENPGSAAFLRTLDDRASDDEIDLIDIVEDESQEFQLYESQSQEQSQEREEAGRILVPNSQPATTTTAATNNTANGTVPTRPPAAMRRTKNGKRPSGIGELRESLSSLLDDPTSDAVALTDIDSDDSDDDDTAMGDKENVGPAPPLPLRNGVVRDRISLKRSGSSSSGSRVSANGRHAFSMGSTQGSDAPTLLRRATSNSLASSGLSVSSNGVSDARGGGSRDGAMFGEKIKKGAGRGTGVGFGGSEAGKGAGYGRRAAEAGAGVGKGADVGAVRRRERKMKGAEERLRAAKGLFGGVDFE